MSGSRLPVRPSGPAGAPELAAAAVLGPIGIAVAWLVLTGATGLNYHLLPLATAAAPSVALRRLGPSAAPPGRAVALAAGWGAAVSAAALLLLAALGRPLDPAPVLVALVAAGASAAAWWARRRGTRPAP